MPVKRDLPSAGARLATWLAEAPSDSVPLRARELVHRAAIDTIAVAVAGAGDPVATAVSAMLAENESRAVARQIGGSLATSAEDAALLNGTAAHALDYDDVLVAASAHGSAVVLPAALAIAEATGASGRAFLSAFAFGLETVARCGRAMGRAHYARGWHATSTLGAIGAMAAAGRLLRLDSNRMLSALGVAASFASGVRQNFGTMAKPLHAGHAARGGVVAARLASLGFTASSEALDGPHGFFAVFGYGESKPELVVDTEWELERSGIATKPYPCCFALHRAVEATLGLRATHRLEPSEIARVDVAVPVGGLAPLLSTSQVVDGTTGKFSMGHTLSTALLDGAVSRESFGDAMLMRPDVRQLAHRVHAIEDASIPIDGHPLAEGWADVRITLSNGVSMSQRVAAPLGSPARPLGEAEVAAKFHDCAASVLGPARAETALTMLHSLDASATTDSLMTVLSLTTR